MPTRLPPESTLLCESCGYDVESLPHSSSCPECGRPIAQSLPTHRPGTPVQQRHTLSSLVRTWHLTLTRARATFDQAGVASPNDTPLRAASLVFAALIAPAGVILPTLIIEATRDRGHSRDSLDSGGFAYLFLLAAAALGTIALLPTLAILTYIEERGIRFWGPRRGWRITPAIARTICAHASVGWVLGAVLMVAGHLLGLVLADIPNRHNLGVFRGAFQLSPITLPALGFLAGMLTFEILVYLGMTRMRFANRLPTTPDASISTAPLPAPLINTPTGPPSPS